MGEVFDKVGKRLGLPYPQGPRVDELAELGAGEALRLTMPRIKSEPFFSYSGIKTQAIREIERLERQGVAMPEAGDTPPAPVLDLLAAFRRVCVDQVIDRLHRLHRSRPVGTLAVSGGVAANRLLRRELARWARHHGVDLRLVPLAFSGDNAAMIAFAALARQRRGIRGDPRDLVVASRIPFTSLEEAP